MSATELELRLTGQSAEPGRAQGDPLVSIVTPAYNATRFVPQTIESVLSQTYTDWELLIVDDCSEDDTVSVVGSYATRDSRVCLLRHQRNCGPAQARETALQASRGRYIAFLDSDDLWLPQKLEHQLAFMQRRQATLCFTQFRRVDAEGHTVGRLINIPERLTYRDLLKNTAIATSSVIIDRDKAGPFQMTRTYYDDYALWLQILRRGFVAHGLREDLMRYRVVGKSVSRNKLRSATMVWRLYRDVERLGVLQSAWCFSHYAARAVFKYRTF
jgi:teichuronic acid biosynthesis glycosyltransferase TuaG